MAEMVPSPDTEETPMVAWLAIEEVMIEGSVVQARIRRGRL